MLEKHILSLFIKYAIIAFFPVFFLLSACSEIQVKAVQTPPPSPKVRVFILAFTESKNPLKKKVSPAEFVEITYKRTGRFLSDTGIYEVVPQKELETIVDWEKIPLSYWTKDGYEFTKKVGKALYADFVMIANRTPKYISYEFINVETGKNYEARYDAPLGMKLGPFEGISMSEDLYYKIFMDAKEDLMSIAIRKGRVVSQVGTKKEIVQDKTSLSSKAPSQVSPSDSSLISSPNLKEAVPAKPYVQDKTRIIVYDFDSIEWLNVVALILSDALREELYRLGRFRLVNRENMQKVLEELKLQQSGLVNEKQLVQIGQWLSAEEVIAGKLSPLGNTIILQAKRLNMKTMETAAIGSIKCSAGNEEKLLSDIPELAKRLIGNMGK